MAKTKDNYEMPITAGGFLISLGVVYGDIGTSPLYVMKSIVAGQGGLSGLSTDFLLGALSLVIWTLTLMTTMKYVLVAMRADNHGEGGIFALYTIVQKRRRWLFIPAIIGGAALLADGVLTPAVTVTSAIEGLESIPAMHALINGEQWKIIAMTLLIIVFLFAVQHFGTSTIGRAFGPAMLLWFVFLGGVGLWAMLRHPVVLAAFNPLHAIHLLFSENNKAGFMILGSVFLATTGAEALYSDIGHVGRGHIYISWPFVKICLLLNYLGQGAWLIDAAKHPELASVHDFNPFFAVLPEHLRPVAVVLSAIAAIIASQALISGAFTLVSEAINLSLLPHLRIQYPAKSKGQMYIPLVNTLLMLACIAVVLHFRDSAHMEAAYGLAITVTMLMTTVLLYQYMRSQHWSPLWTMPFIAFFLAIEATFFFSSVRKFSHGGYVAAALALVIALIMFIWQRSSAIERSQRTLLPAKAFLPQLAALRKDTTQPLLATNLVYLTENEQRDALDRDILYSILDKRPKRAAVYWFIYVQVTEEPFTRAYTIENFGTDHCFKVNLKLGYKVPQTVNIYMRQIINDVIAAGETPPQKPAYTITPGRQVGDFLFIMIQKTMTADIVLPEWERMIMRAKYLIKHHSGSPIRWFGLENTNVRIESVPLFIREREVPLLTRITP